MVPDSWSRESLGFFFAENLLVAGIFFWEFRCSFLSFVLFCELQCLGLFQSCWEGYVGHMYNMIWRLSRDVSLPRNEVGFVRILGPEDHRKLFRCYPSSHPVDVRLHCREPRIAQNNVSVTYVSQEEA